VGVIFKTHTPGERALDDKKTGREPEKTSLQEREEDTDSRGEPSTENYAEHLARVTPNADSSKALLKARYKARHDAEQDANHDDTDTD